ncbi:hypothetical protein [Duganella vulcania]|uniref:Uncharacterized protein n=1 Tax=Duganella vulcania TaxID=2692166 RepID=A0A845GNU4_9BURK|nr:hypothetical protein [Duganella vulcania]MYM96203.1 hypothetical protein [Duganella vulcania]
MRTIPALHGLGTRMWRAVTMELRVPYYFVCHAVKEDGIWLHESCFLWREADVIDLCQDVVQDVRRKISQLSMLLPAESGRWVMEEVEEVWTLPAADEQAAIFFARDRRQMGHTTDMPLATFDQEKQKIYSRPRARNKGNIR